MTHRICQRGRGKVKTEKGKLTLYLPWGGKKRKYSNWCSSPVGQISGEKLPMYICPSHLDKDNETRSCTMPGVAKLFVFPLGSPFKHQKTRQPSGYVASNSWTLFQRAARQVVMSLTPIMKPFPDRGVFLSCVMRLDKIDFSPLLDWSCARMGFHVEKWISPSFGM